MLNIARSQIVSSTQILSSPMIRAIPMLRTLGPMLLSNTWTNSSLISSTSLATRTFTKHPSVKNTPSNTQSGPKVHIETPMGLKKVMLEPTWIAIPEARIPIFDCRHISLSPSVLKQLEENILDFLTFRRPNSSSYALLLRTDYQGQGVVDVKVNLLEVNLSSEGFSQRIVKDFTGKGALAAGKYLSQVLGSTCSFLTLVGAKGPNSQIRVPIRHHRGHHEIIMKDQNVIEKVSLQIKEQTIDVTFMIVGNESHAITLGSFNPEYLRDIRSELNRLRDNQMANGLNVSCMNVDIQKKSFQIVTLERDSDQITKCDETAIAAGFRVWKDAYHGTSKNLICPETYTMSVSEGIVAVKSQTDESYSISFYLKIFSL